jgi:hypothetical protein
MYHILNYIQLFSQFCCQKINSKIVKCGMVVLTIRKNTNMTDADVAID